MNLLVLTQKVDKEDPILGFFHRWLISLANHCEKITVICLEEGTHVLPENVRVISLGKERGCSRRQYLSNFFRFIWRERKNYSSVFVHMNEEYVLLGGLLWRSWGKRVLLWRNHPHGNFWTRLAIWLAHAVFCTSEFSFTARFKKTRLMPAGIDTEWFKPVPKGSGSSLDGSGRTILCLGRISPIKKIEYFIEALCHLRAESVSFKADIIGNARPGDMSYERELHEKVRECRLEELASFSSGVPNQATRELYRSHRVYVNLTPTGSFDKTILEAMSCGALVVASNRSLEGKVDSRFIFKENDARDLAKKLRVLLDLDDRERELLGAASRRFVAEHHGLEALIRKIVSAAGENNKSYGRK